MSLESRAAQASRSLHVSVAGATPLGMSAIARRQRTSVFTSFAAAAVFVVAFAGIATAMPNFFDPDSVAGDSMPDPDLPVVVDPDDKPTDGQVVDLDDKPAAPPVRQANSVSDSPEPWTKFYGEAAPGTTVSAVSTWGTAELVVDGRGEFSLKLEFDPLPPPGVEFPVVVTMDGVEYQFGFTSLWDPSDVGITANQMFGVSDDPEPYEKLFGSAPPGTEVSTTSPYGAAATVSDDTGQWSMKVFFEGAPANEPFDMMVTAGSETFTFGFVSQYEPAPVAFSLSQRNSTSDSSSPYVRFSGTGEPGTAISAQSPYGSQSITIGGSGGFDFKLWFSSLPPAGEQFSVSVKVAGSTYGSYPFTSYYAKETGGGGEEAPASVSVSQYNTESWDDTPWAKFNVTGPVGTQVELISSYGTHAQTTSSINEYVKLWFSSLPPAGVEFPITVKINGDVFGTYAFTSHFDPAGVSVSVSQYNTESSDQNPWAKFNVTGPVGTVVDILSPYGNASQTLSSTNEHVKLWFSSLPPAGEPFTLTVKIDGGVWGSYGFTSWYSEPAPVAKTANATYGTCAEDPPYDVYFGTAPEGTSISITSAYGSGSTTANGSGEWSKQVFFSGAPLDEPFTVNVQVGGASFDFQMVVTASG